MPNQKILYITTEMSPYQDDSMIAETVNKLALKMHGAGNDVRVFMPRFGLISERKYQLHEVIRLSGMNIIINDLDQPLLIKVASLPGERLQVYFIDNEEYFKRKAYYLDEENNPFKDNGERAVFFARGVVETIKKLNWVPDVIHLNGWMAAFVPLYIKTFYKKDSYFNDTKFVLSVYNTDDVKLEGTIKDVLAFDKVDMELPETLSFHTFVKEAMNNVDLVLKGDEYLEEDLQKAFDTLSTEKSDYLDVDEINKIY